ncbi:MAG TPA: nucleotidyltransferase family protein [bacterium]
MSKKSSDKILKIIEQKKDELKKRFKMKEIGLFGSYTKGEHTEASDVDILVEFEKGHKTFDNYMDLKFFLEDLLGMEIDLVIKEAIRKELKDVILTETVYV